MPPSPTRRPGLDASGQRARSLIEYYNPSNRDWNAAQAPEPERTTLAKSVLTPPGAITPTPPQDRTPATGRWIVSSDTTYFHGPGGEILGEYRTQGSAYSQETVWFNGAPVATRINGVLYNVSSDHLGTPRSIARASDNVEVWRWHSDPFGNSAPTAPAGPASAITYNLRLPGQMYDGTSGYYYNGMRDYDPYTGRYIQADPIGLAGGLSRYGYVGGIR